MFFLCTMCSITPAPTSRRLTESCILQHLRPRGQHLPSVRDGVRAASGNSRGEGGRTRAQHSSGWGFGWGIQVLMAYICVLHGRVSALSTNQQEVYCWSCHFLSVPGERFIFADRFVAFLLTTSKGVNECGMYHAVYFFFHQVYGTLDLGFIACVDGALNLLCFSGCCSCWVLGRKG